MTRRTSRERQLELAGAAMSTLALYVLLTHAYRWAANTPHGRALVVVVAGIVYGFGW